MNFTVLFQFVRINEFKKKFYCLIKLELIMIKIEAIVRNSVLHEIQDALAKIGIPTFSSY